MRFRCTSSDVHCLWFDGVCVKFVGCLLSLGVNGRWSLVINKSCFALQNWVWFTLMDFVVSAG